MVVPCFSPRVNPPFFQSIILSKRNPEQLTLGRLTPESALLIPRSLPSRTFHLLFAKFSPSQPWFFVLVAATEPWWKSHKGSVLVSLTIKIVSAGLADSHFSHSCSKLRWSAFYFETKAQHPVHFTAQKCFVITNVSSSSDHASLKAFCLPSSLWSGRCQLSSEICPKMGSLCCLFLSSTRGLPCLLANTPNSSFPVTLCSPTQYNIYHTSNFQVCCPLSIPLRSNILGKKVCL